MHIILNCCKIGIAYAAVFPEPVFAFTNISFPLSAKGIAAVWTIVGFVKFAFAIALSILGSNPNVSKPFSVSRSSII